MRLSVIIPTYRRPDLLARTLNSVMLQDLNGWSAEVVVVDDDPNGTAYSVVDKQARKYQGEFELKYIENTGGLSGVSSARNRGISESSGDWLLFLDDDDFLIDGAVSILLNSADSCVCDFVFGNYRIIEENSSGDIVAEHEMELEGYFEDRLLIKNYIPVGGYIIKREKVLFNFDCRMSSLEDWLFLIDNLIGAKKEVNVSFVADYILSVTRSIDQSRNHRNIRSSRHEVGNDYLKIYSMYPAKRLLRARLAVLGDLGCPNTETLLGWKEDACGFTLPTRYGRFFISNPKETIQRSLVETGSFEEIGPQLAIAWCQNKVGAIIDVGANQGVFSIPVARGLRASRLIAIEPQSMVFMQLCTNILLNGLTNVLVKQCAIGGGDEDSVRVPRFNIYSENYTGSVSLDSETMAIRGKIPGVEEPGERASKFEMVPKAQLSSIWPEDENVLFIKVDVEGMEKEVLESGQGKILKDKPALLFESWNLPAFDTKNSELMSFVESLGYISVSLGNDRIAFHRESELNDTFKGLVSRHASYIPDDVSLVPSWFLSFKLHEKTKLSLCHRFHGLCVAVFVVVRKGGEVALDETLRSFEFLNGNGVRLSVFILKEHEVYLASKFPSFCSVLDMDENDISAAVFQTLRELKSDWFTVLEAGEYFFEDPLVYFLGELSSAPASCEVVYADMALDNAFVGRSMFNLDGFLSNPGLSFRNFFFRSTLCNEEAISDGKVHHNLNMWLSLEVLEKSGMGAFGHVDVPLVCSLSRYCVASQSEQKTLLETHLRRRNYETAEVRPGKVDGTYALKYGHKRKPLVSIIISTKDKLSLLQTCVETLLEKTAYTNFELMIVDKGSKEPEAVAWLQGLESMSIPNIRVVRCHGSMNFSAVNNYAAEEARGEYLLFLSNHTGILHADWLDELLNHAQRPEVGVVGGKLLFPNGKIQSAGVVAGMRGPGGHVGAGSAADDPGYMKRLLVDQNYSAVSSACMLVRRTVYQQIGGFDEMAFPSLCSDLDFCFKVIQGGYLVVWTPHCQLMHVSNARQDSVGETPGEQKEARLRREQETMYERWLPYIGNDPAFNRNLSLRATGFEVERRVELNWQPQKALDLPTVLVHPADQWGCGHYRIMQPLESMKSQGIAGGMVARHWLTVPEMARLEPDALVYQRQITLEAVENMKHARRFLQKPVVYELDDYLPNLPLKSAYRQNMPKDILKSLRRSLKHVDRFVVSTHPLAEAFKGIHPDIYVVENCLPLDWWGELPTSRRGSEKPRVGWAGGIGHTGDLELVESVVRDLSNEVDWVFFGMCPEKLRPCVKEVHEGVDIALYPEKLASMNLDLAIAPLEDNLFNRCKSNLRLLEYGACGFPVVCSDVEPYRVHGLPVTRVKNRYKDWLDAIRMHLSDLNETAKQGKELRRVVRRDWMLEGDNLQQWLNAWTKF